MTFEINVTFEPHSVEAEAIDSIVKSEHISPEQAVRKLIRQGADQQEAVANSHEYIFTPDVLAELDEIMTEIDNGGRLYTLEETYAFIEDQSREWLVTKK